MMAARGVPGDGKREPGGRHGEALRQRDVREAASRPTGLTGGIGYSTELDVERYYRDAPLMIVGEGTNEIQRNVVARADPRGLP